MRKKEKRRLVGMQANDAFPDERGGGEGEKGRRAKKKGGKREEGGEGRSFMRWS